MPGYNPAYGVSQNKKALEVSQYDASYAFVFL